MESVGDHIRRHVFVGENFPQNSWITMIQGAHGIERMGGVPRTRRNATPREFQGSVRVTDAHAYSAPCRLGDYFACPIEFGRNRHHPNVSACCLPQFLEPRNGWRKQVFWGMHAPARMTEEWPRKVNAQRASTTATVSTFHGSGQPLYSAPR